MTGISNLQAGPVLALSQLLMEHPELPAMRWGLAPDGHLGGHNEDVPDVDAALAEFSKVLGAGHTHRAIHTDDVGDCWVSLYFFPVWRDVQFHITLHGLTQEAPAGLPAAWTATAVAS